MSTSRDTKRRVLADCPCSGCTATRVLADVLAELDALIASERARLGDHVHELNSARLTDSATLWQRASVNEIERHIKKLESVRRAARGGRDGGKACP